MTKYNVRVLTNEGIVDWKGNTRYSLIWNKNFDTINEVANYIDTFKSFPRYDFIVYDNNKLILDTTTLEQIHIRNEYNSFLDYREYIKKELRGE